MLDLITKNIVEIIIGAIATGVFGVLKSQSKILKGLKVSSIANGHDKLYRFCKFYIETNQITFEELENLEHIYEGYAMLGGNGTGKDLYEKCKRLPVVEVRTKYNPYYTSREHEHE